MNIHQLAPDEPLSPELVLVLPPELRAQAIAALGPPVWPTPPPPLPPPLLSPVLEAPAPVREAPVREAPVREAPVREAPVREAPVREPFVRSLSELIAARFVHLGLIFAIVTIVTLALSLVAHAVR